MKTEELKAIERHTPGPWFQAEQKTKPHNHALIGIGNGASHVGYASVTPATPPLEADANARLFAAAPKLLAERNALLDQLLKALPYVEDHLTNPCFKKGIVARDVASIRAAITLADS